MLGSSQNDIQLSQAFGPHSHQNQVSEKLTYSHERK